MQLSQAVERKKKRKLLNKLPTFKYQEQKLLFAGWALMNAAGKEDSLCTIEEEELSQAKFK